MIRGTFLFLVLVGEMAMLAVLGSLIMLGRMPTEPQVLIWAGGLILALAAAIPVGIGYAAARRLSVHGALVLGSLIFSLPFVWLVSTSFKYPEETFVYPPQWLPAIPQAVTSSPYIESNPAGADWAQTPEAESLPAPWSQLEEQLWEAARAWLPADRLEYVDEAEARAALTPGLWAAVRQRVPGAFWEQATADEAARRAGDELIAPIVDQVWADVYRAVELGLLTVDDILRRTHPIAGQPAETWRMEGDTPVSLHELPASDGQQPHALLHYETLEPGQRVRLTRQIDLPVSPDELLSLTVPMRQDRSWHRVRAELELAGQRYTSRDTLTLGGRGHREMTFKLHERDPRDERELGIWPLHQRSDQAQAFDAPDQARLTLEIEAVPRWLATVYKYTQTYRDAWYADEHWGYYLFNSVYLVVLNVLGQIICCSLAAFAFSRLHWPGRELVFGLVLATMMLPATVMLIPQFLIFKQLGWYNTLLPLWVPALAGTPFFIFLLRQFMLTLPRELEDAARIDGAGWFGVYWRITLPLMRPGLAAVGIFTFINVWNEFMGPLIFLSDERLFPLSLGLFNFQSEHGGDFGMLMAASTLMVLPVMAVFFLAQRYFIEGVTLTGIKG